MSNDTASSSHDAQRIPRLVRGVRIREDAVRGGWVMLAPEKVFKLDNSGREIMQLVDGERSEDTIVTALAEKFDADRALIATDVATYLDSLVERQVVEFV